LTGPPDSPDSSADLPEPTEPQPPISAPPSSRLGTGTFTIEGRAAPGLFVLAWLTLILGAGVFGIGGLSGGPIRLGLIMLGLALLSVGLVAGAGSQAFERRARGVEGYAGPSPFLVFAGSVPIAILLNVAVAILLDVLGVPTSAPGAILLFLLATAVPYLLLVRLTVVGTDALSWAEMGWRRPDRAAVRDTLAALTLVIPVLAATGLLGALLAQFLPLPQSPLPQAADPAGWIANAIAACLIAPVAEETFFRGFATTAWLRRIGPTAAIVRGALFFAFVHVLAGTGGSEFLPALETAAFAFVVRLPIALALGWIFVRSRALLPSIVLHAAFNGLSLLASLAGS
jgi:membrane protease YdiL (CAAX protease family)